MLDNWRKISKKYRIKNQVKLGALGANIGNRCFWRKIAKY